MKAIGVIPARWGSTRFPGKPVRKILGQALIQWVIQGARQSKVLSQLIVATDDERIAEVARLSGVEVAMTDPSLPTGSDRVWAAVKDRDCDVVVNIQGDEPLLEGHWLDRLVSPLQDQNADMATLGREISEEELNSLSTAKIIMNSSNEALYFSRYPIPFSRGPFIEGLCLKHIGLYAYRKDFLADYCQKGPVALEQAESLEQLRALYLGAKIAVTKVDFDSWGVDHPHDIERVESKLRERGLNG